MKKILLTGMLGAMILASCGSSDKKALEFSEKVASNVNTDNIEWIKGVYPAADFDSIGFVDYAVPEIGESGEKGIIRVNFGSKAWIDLKLVEDGSFEIVKSHGIAAFPASKLKIAEETGMISENMADTEIQKRMADKRFFNWMKTKVENIISIEPGPEQRWTRELDDGIYFFSNCKVTNNSSVEISGKDYNVSFVSKLTLPNYPPGTYTGRENGVDLNPGETKTLRISGYGNKLSEVKVNLNLPEDKLAGLVKPTGQEYAEFISLYGEPSPADATRETTPQQALASWPSQMPQEGNIDQFAWLSTYKLTPGELTAFSKPDLRILRNAIFALHGYTFKSKDLREYFSRFSGYEPVTSDVNDFSPTENANIMLIQSME